MVAMASGMVFTMIDDPINMRRKTERPIIEHFQRTNVPFFYKTENLIGLLKTSGIPLWSIAHRDNNGGQYYKPGYYIGSSTESYNNNRTRDEMMELLETEYQEYLEWFLWHPGWL